jgi:hypothetical protein
VGNDKHDFKKGLKGRLVIVFDVDVAVVGFYSVRLQYEETSKTFVKLSLLKRSG